MQDRENIQETKRHQNADSKLTLSSSALQAHVCDRCLAQERPL